MINRYGKNSENNTLMTKVLPALKSSESDVL
jgi:hypothetical protein